MAAAFQAVPGDRPLLVRDPIDAGHCPFDEAPGAVNDRMLAFLERL